MNPKLQNIISKYEELDKLAASGEDVVADLRKEINNLELEYLKETVFPQIANTMGSMVNGLRCQIDGSLQLTEDNKISYSFCTSRSMLMVQDNIAVEDCKESSMSGTPSHEHISIASEPIVIPDLRIEDYSEKAIVVRGDTRQISDILEAEKGILNFKLKGGPGWIFPKKKHDRINSILQPYFGSSNIANETLQSKDNNIEATTVRTIQSETRSFILNGVKTECANPTWMLVNLINMLGPERVYNLRIAFLGGLLVDNAPNSRYPYACKALNDGYWVNTQSTTTKKYAQMKYICSKLKADIVFDFDYNSKNKTTQKSSDKNTTLNLSDRTNQNNTEKTARKLSDNSSQNKSEKTQRNISDKTSQIAPDKPASKSSAKATRNPSLETAHNSFNEIKSNIIAKSKIMDGTFESKAESDLRNYFTNEEIDWIDKLMNMRQSFMKGYKSPHKAIFLLSIIELIKKNVLRDHIIYATDVLNEEFNTQWKKYVSTDNPFSPNMYQPFMHLSGENFYKLEPIEGIKHFDMHQYWNKSSVKRFVKYGVLNISLFYLFKNKKTSDKIKELLIDHYLKYSTENKINNHEINNLNNKDTEHTSNSEITQKTTKTLYSLNGSCLFGRERIVLETVRQYLMKHPKSKFIDLVAAFPPNLQGTYGVIKSIENIERRSYWYPTEKNNWFLKPSEIMTSSDGIKFAVCSAWNNQFFGFRRHVKNKLGWAINEVNI